MCWVARPNPIFMDTLRGIAHPIEAIKIGVPLIRSERGSVIRKNLLEESI